LFAVLFALLSTASAGVALSGHALLLNENQVLYLFSTSGQVIAGIYGLTLTGFIFFRNELSREELEDETLTEAVEALKKRYFELLLFISALVILTILLANLAISFEAVGPIPTNTIIINVGQSAFVTSLASITYFIFDVISPKRIEVVSRRLQSKVDPKSSQQTKGGLEEFLRNYNQIEALLTDAGQPYQQTTSATYEPRYIRRISNARLAEMLVRGERIGKDLFHKIRELITLRNAIIHGAEPVVSQDLVQTSAQVLNELREALAP
jgi:hypothetical protein